MQPETTERCATCPALRKCAFHNLREPLHREFRKIAEIRAYSPGVDLVRQGDSPHGIFNLRSGSVRMLHLEPTGKATAVGMLGAGGILGLTEVHTGTRYPYTAETVRKTTLEYVPRKRFVPFLLEHPQVAVELLTWLSQEYEDLRESWCGIAARPRLRMRLLDHLRSLGETCGRATTEGLELAPVFTGQDLADGVGCSRQWISKLLGELEHQGLIKRRRRRIVITAASCEKAGSEYC